MEVQCQLCEEVLESLAAVQLHQVVECPAVETEDKLDKLNQAEDEMRVLVKHFEGLRVAGLKVELRNRGLGTDDNKGTLQQRLYGAEGLT